MDSRYEKCLQKVQLAKQEHLLSHWSEMDASERTDLLEQLEQLDFERLDRMLLAAKTPAAAVAADMIRPLDKTDLVERETFSDHDLARYRHIGFTAIRQGKIAVIIMAGGMGTRLGSNLPKGMYDLGLNSTRTLFELQAKRLLKLESLAASASASASAFASTTAVANEPESLPVPSIPLYVMTSAATDSETRQHFMANNYFGLKSENVYFFEQNQLPCYDLNDRIIMRTRSQLARSPDGNGGIYRALTTGRVLDDMRSRGIRYVHVYCVDNILIRVADPVFMGVSIAREADAAVKVIEKRDWAEPVGIVCKTRITADADADADAALDLGPASASAVIYHVLEYSEMPDAIKQERRPKIGSIEYEPGSVSKTQQQSLVYNTANIANHFFDIDFLNEFESRNFDEKLPIHLARKQIESLSGEKVAGIKLEKFVFDSLPFAKRFFAFRVRRDEEFSPLKNGPDSSEDNVRTCRRDLYRLHRRFIENAGGLFHRVGNAVNDCEPVCEIDPALSYEGENLTELVAGSVLEFPLVLLSPVTSPSA